MLILLLLGLIRNQRENLFIDNVSVSVIMYKIYFHQNLPKCNKPQNTSIIPAQKHNKIAAGTTPKDTELV